MLPPRPRSPRRHAGLARVGLLGAALAFAADARAQVCDGISVASPTPLTTVRIASGLTRPLLVTAPPGDTRRRFIVEQDGRIRIVRDGALRATPFLDLSALTRSPTDPGGGEEQGLLGLAFHPDYAVNGWFFVYHTDATGANNLVVRYTRSSDPDLADPASSQLVLTIPHPNAVNHNGGHLAFGPLDGYLYIGTGDGSFYCNLQGFSQDPGSLEGKLLRIDVNALPYTIPPDNPFAGPDGVLDEIWALGLRNPWRFAFDPDNGDLYLGDVGQDLYEEIDYRRGTSGGGENYGWSDFEGSHCPNPSCGGGNCSLPGRVQPIGEYSHAVGCAVTGGPVYRGCRMPALRGTYFVADYCAAFVRTARVVRGAVTDLRDRTAELAPGGGLTIADITSFGVDARGEIYIVDQGLSSPQDGGEVFQVVPILPNLEVSGVGATPFLPAAGGDWTWEDLAATSSHPIDIYRVYRLAGQGSGPFACVHAGAGAAWTGGDTAAPPPGGLFSYVVTARNAAGAETGRGLGSGGVVRTLAASACPP